MNKILTSCLLAIVTGASVITSNAIAASCPFAVRQFPASGTSQGFTLTCGGGAGKAAFRAFNLPPAFKKMQTELQSGASSRVRALNVNGIPISQCDVTDTTKGDGPKEAPISPFGGCDQASRWLGDLTF
jgi:hypothetical protein